MIRRKRAVSDASSLQLSEKMKRRLSGRTVGAQSEVATLQIDPFAVVTSPSSTSLAIAALRFRIAGLGELHADDDFCMKVCK